MSWASTVTVQMDNASPHTGGNTLQILANEGVTNRRGGTKIVLERQVANSPDSNANDLAFFPSLSARVSKRKMRMTEDLVREVHTCYAQYDSATLTRVFEYKSLIMSEIVKAQGNNTYKLPHHPRS